MNGGALEDRDGEILRLGIDIGTSRIKIAAYDARLHLVREHSGETSAFPGSSRGELNAESLWQVVKLQLVDLLSRLETSHVRAIGITGMAESGCLIDAESRPLTPVLLWHDRRGVRQAASLRRRAGSECAKITGLKTTSVRSISKWMWLTDHGASRQARWCGVPEWIALRLTGNWLTDETLAVRTGAFDVLAGDYSPQVLDLAGAPRNLFPPACGTPARAGNILGGMASELGLREDLQVVVAGHDDIVAGFGAGGRPGDLIDSAGTAEGLIRVVGEPPIPAETVAAGMAMTRFYEPGTWALLAGAGSTGALMQLAAATLDGDPAVLDMIAAQPGQYPEGIIDVRLSKNVLPTIKIKKGAARPEVWSAVLDLVCERVQEAAERMSGLAGGATRLILVGGAARSGELVRRKSARLKLPPVVMANVDVTTRGAAALAALACPP